MSTSHRIYPFRLLLTLSYWFFLSWELLVSNPLEVIFQVPERTPQWDLSSEPISFSLHITSYFILGLLLLWRSSHQKKLLIALYSLAFLHAGLFEWLQTYVPQRWPNLWDFVANTLGLLLGLGLFYLTQKYRYKASTTS